MKKPGISISKKGAMLNILWIMVENPTNLSFFRVMDIKKLLEDEFGIELDRKTISEYLSILVDLKFLFELSHESNKGYYISNKMIDDSKRDILLNAIESQKVLTTKEKLQLYDYVMFDLSKNERNQIIIKNNLLDIFRDNHDEGNEFSEKLMILERAIKERRAISFEYLLFDKTGSFKKQKIEYHAIPFKIYFQKGMYYLFTLDRLWENIYCGIKIKYMSNIRFTDVVDPNMYRNLDVNYVFEVGIFSDWTIEFIDETFEDYTLKREKTGLKAVIKAPYDLIFDWCKRFSPFFEIYDERIKNDMRKNFHEILSTIDKKDKIIYNIKGAITNYYYDNPISSKSECDTYISKLKKEIIFELRNLGYLKANALNIYQNESEKIALEIIDFNITKEGLFSKEEMQNLDFEREFNRIKKAKENLQSLDVSRRYIVLLYSYLSDFESKRLCEMLNVNALGDIFDQFSKLGKAYHYKYSVVEIC